MAAIAPDAIAWFFQSEVGREILLRLAAELTEVALVEVAPRQEGMTMVQVLSLRKDLTPTKSGSEKREGAKAHATRE